MQLILLNVVFVVESTPPDNNFTLFPATAEDKFKICFILGARITICLNIISVNDYKFRIYKMSLCSAAEIAEKKRIASEKLRAKKAQHSIITNNNNTGGITINSNHTSYNTNVPKLTSTPTLANASSKNVGRAENRASSFLSDLKGSNVFVQRQQQQNPARDAAHPYKKPSTEGATNFYKKQNTNVFVDKPKGPISTTTPQKQLASVFVKTVTCKVAMITPLRFEVQPSSYHAQLIEVFKSIPSKSYGMLKGAYYFCFDSL